LRPAKGIFYCSDVALTAANERTATIELSPGHRKWSGLLYLTVWAKNGALTLTLGDDEVPVLVDSFSGYSNVVDASAVPEITVNSTSDATARVLIEIL